MLGLNIRLDNSSTIWAIYTASFEVNTTNSSEFFEEYQPLYYSIIGSAKLGNIFTNAK